MTCWAEELIMGRPLVLCGLGWMEHRVLKLVPRFGDERVRADCHSWTAMSQKENHLSGGGAQKADLLTLAHEDASDWRAGAGYAYYFQAAVYGN